MNRPWFPGRLLPHLQQKTVDAPRFLMPPPATPENVRAEIERAIAEDTPVRRGNTEQWTVLEIMHAVCRRTSISMLDLRGERRPPHLYTARHIVFWLARRHTTKSYPIIGRIAGTNGRPKDHTTVMNGVKRVERALVAEGMDTTTVRSVDEEIDMILKTRWAEEYLYGAGL